MRRFLLASFMISVASPLAANDWEKFYTPIFEQGTYLPSVMEPEIISSTGNDEDDMFRKGFVAVGYTEFSTSNGKTKDAMRLAKKLKARFVTLSVNLDSSTVISVPMTLPSSTTSNTTGSVSVTGSGGTAIGRYSGTTITSGTQTTYIPMTVNRFSKGAVYWAEAPKLGTGILSRDLDPAEIAKFETNRGFVIVSVRNNSPAYYADLLRGDIVLRVNEIPIDNATWQQHIKTDKPMVLQIIRKSEERQITLTVPPEWQPE